MEGIKLLTISLGDDDGFEIDWEGMSIYEAWALCYWAYEELNARLEGASDADDD